MSLSVSKFYNVILCVLDSYVTGADNNGIQNVGFYESICKYLFLSKLIEFGDSQRCPDAEYWCPSVSQVRSLREWHANCYANKCYT